MLPLVMTKDISVKYWCSVAQFVDPNEYLETELTPSTYFSFYYP